MPIESHWTAVSGSRVHYLVTGPESGLPIVLLHGASFQARTWQETGTLEALARAGFRAYAVDLPGYGESPAANVAHETWLRDLLDALAIVRPVVVSPSMSGRFSLPLLTSDPQRLAGFVAVAPVGIPPYEDKLPKVSIPILAIWGETDRIVSHAQQDLLADTAPNARKVTIAGGGHAPYMQDAATFNAELLKFLSELAGESAP